MEVDTRGGDIYVVLCRLAVVVKREAGRQGSSVVRNESSNAGSDSGVHSSNRTGIFGLGLLKDRSFG